LKTSEMLKGKLRVYSYSVDLMVACFIAFRVSVLALRIDCTLMENLEPKRRLLRKRTGKFEASINLPQNLLRKKTYRTGKRKNIFSTKNAEQMTQMQATMDQGMEGRPEMAGMTPEHMVAMQMQGTQMIGPGEGFAAAAPPYISDYRGKVCSVYSLQPDI